MAIIESKNLNKKVTKKKVQKKEPVELLIKGINS